MTAGALPRRLPRAALLVLAGLPGVLSLLLPGMQVAGFGSAVLGAIVVSVVAWLAARFIGRDEERG